MLILILSSNFTIICIVNFNINYTVICTDKLAITIICSVNITVLILVITIICNVTIIIFIPVLSSTPGGQGPEREVYLLLKHGVEAKSYDEVTLSNFLICFLIWQIYFKFCYTI